MLNEPNHNYFSQSGDSIIDIFSDTSENAKNIVSEDSLMANNMTIVSDAEVAGEIHSGTEMKVLDMTHIYMKMPSTPILPLMSFYKSWTGGSLDTTEMVHPSVVYFPKGYGPKVGDTVIGVSSRSDKIADDTIVIDAGHPTPNWQYFLFMTPYTYPSLENPSLRVSNQKDSGYVIPYAIGYRIGTTTLDTVWVRDPIFDSSIYNADSISTNLLIRKGINGHLSDPVGFRDENNNLWCAFRMPDTNRSTGQTRFLLFGVMSDDGITWKKSDWRIFAYVSSSDKTHLDSTWEFICPSIVQDRGGLYRLYFINGDGAVPRTVVTGYTTDILNIGFSNWDTVSMGAVTPTDSVNLWLWHPDFFRRGKEILCISELGTSIDSGWYFWKSTDRLNFTRRKDAILKQGTAAETWATAQPYKGSGIWIDDGRGGKIGWWYSACANGGIYVGWHIGYAEIYFYHMTAKL